MWSGRREARGGWWSGFRRGETGAGASGIFPPEKLGHYRSGTDAVSNARINYWKSLEPLVDRSLIVGRIFARWHHEVVPSRLSHPENSPCGDPAASSASSSIQNESPV